MLKCMLRLFTKFSTEILLKVLCNTMTTTSIIPPMCYFSIQIYSKSLYSLNHVLCWLVGFMMFNATFNNISDISWRSVLLVEETTDLLQVTDKLYHIMLHKSLWAGVEPITSVTIGTDNTGSCKSNYHIPYDHGHDVICNT